MPVISSFSLPFHPSFHCGHHAFTIRIRIDLPAFGTQNLVFDVYIFIHQMYWSGKCSISSRFIHTYIYVTIQKISYIYICSISSSADQPFQSIPIQSFHRSHIPLVSSDSSRPSFTDSLFLGWRSTLFSKDRIWQNGLTYFHHLPTEAAWHATTVLPPCHHCARKRSLHIPVPCPHTIWYPCTDCKGPGDGTLIFEGYFCDERNINPQETQHELNSLTLPRAETVFTPCPTLGLPSSHKAQILRATNLVA